MKHVLQRRRRSEAMSRERMFDVLRLPVITEKSTTLSETGCVVMRVALDCNKFEIKTAFEAVFGVKVVAVNTLVRKGKLKRSRGSVGRRSDEKRAFVSLADGQSVDFTATI